MDREIVWTERASADIEAIVRYIARRKPDAAARIGFGIFDRAQILLQQPESGSFLEELRTRGWPKLLYKRWKIVYRVEDHSTIVIGRVWPAAMGEPDLEPPL